MNNLGGIRRPNSLTAQIMSSSPATLAQIGKCSVYFTFTAPSTWVIKCGGSNHMIENKGILSTLISISSLLVTLANGSTTYTEGAGIANATPSLLFSYVLYIPKFKFNLLSISQLTKSLNYSMTSFQNHCVFEKLETQRTIVIGRESGGLYHLERL